MRARGQGGESIVAALLVENERRCNPPLPEDEVRKIAASVAQYPADRRTRAETLAGSVVEDSIKSGVIEIPRGQSCKGTS